jgi:hypothetical protein
MRGAVPVPAIAVTAAIEGMPDAVPRRVERARRRSQRNRWRAIAAHGRAPGAEDAGLLASDGFAVGAEPLGMIDLDTGDHGHVGIDDVHRVEPPAEADLQHHPVERLAAEDLQRRQRAEFEIGQRDLCARLFDRGEGGAQRIVRRLATLHAHALVVAAQVRRGVGADALAQRQQQALDHRDTGSLAVGAAHRDHRGPRPRQPHARGNGADTLQAEDDLRHRMARLQVRQPVGQRSRQGPHRLSRAAHTAAGSARPVNFASNEAMRSRICWRCTIMSIAPCSSRNSLRWKPRGSFWRMVCSMMFGPAKPARA